MNSTRRPVKWLLAGSLAGLLVLAGCGSDDDSSSSPAASSSSSSGGDRAEASSGDACGEFEDADGSSQTFGPVQAYLPKEGLAEEIETRLAPLTAVTPPAELAEAWGAWQGFLEAQDAAVAQLPAGGRLSDPALIEAPADVQAAQQALKDWWFDTCA